MIETIEDIELCIEKLSDEDLIEEANTAYSNLKTASEVAPNSDMHSEAFVGFYMLAEEMNKRNLKLVHYIKE